MRDRVASYVGNQEAHHREVSFEEEFERLLMDAAVHFDREVLFR